MIGTYERTAKKLLKGQSKPKPFAIFIHGHLWKIVKIQHKTKQSRIWELFWRLKQVRKK